MSESQIPPPPTEKKSSPLKWILIGCGIIVVVALLLFATCSVFVAKKAKDFTEGMSDNPAMAAAEMIVRINPEIELVDKDEEAGTLTILNKETGEVATLDLKDIEEGRFGWEADGKKVTIDGSGAEGGEGGLITVRDESGEETVAIGTGSADQVPQWVPRYPGAEEEAPFLMTSGESLNGTLQFESGDSLTEIQEYYSSELENNGFSIETTSFSTAEMESVMLTAEGSDQRTVLVSITDEKAGTTRVGINFSKE